MRDKEKGGGHWWLFISRGDLGWPLHMTNHSSHPDADAPWILFLDPSETTPHQSDRSMLGNDPLRATLMVGSQARDDTALPQLPTALISYSLALLPMPWHLFKTPRESLARSIMHISASYAKLSFVDSCPASKLAPGLNPRLPDRHATTPFHFSKSPFLIGNLRFIQRGCLRWFFVWIMFMLECMDYSCMSLCRY